LQINHGTSICYTLALAGVVIAHCNGDTLTARDRLDLLLQQAQKHSVQLFHTWAQCYEGTAQIADMQGLGLVEDILVTFNARAVDEALFERARSGAAGWCSPEILRVRAEAMADPQGAEALLLEALELAHQQGALAWELRCADSLARRWQQQGRVQAARDLLGSVYARFTEGFATQDLVRVRSLLDELQDKRPA
jgi:ATP/maltotriose-dependent transcriptional regulator MalT